IVKGAAREVIAWAIDRGADIPAEASAEVERINTGGGTALLVAEAIEDSSARVLGVIDLRDIVKPGMADRFAQLREMGIRTVMITDDNELTARSIAREAG
ncbi:potassium-transporting ATPase subunit B, partial [Burkholderia multivorans]